MRGWVWSLLIVCVVLGALSIVWAIAQRPPAETLRAAIEEILADPAYDEPDPALTERAYAAAVKWFVEFFARWWTPQVGYLLEAMPWLYWGIVAILCGLLLALVWHIAWVMISAFRSPRRRVAQTVVTHADSPGELRKRARDLAERGEYSQAIAALHEALVAFLDRQGILRRNSSLTNWEYLQAARHNSGVAREMEPLTLELDNTLYGAASVEASHFRAFEEMVDRVCAAAEVAPSTG